MTPKCALVPLLALILAALAGCGDRAAQNSTPAGTGQAGAEPEKKDKVTLVREKLSPEDRKLVDEQEWCVVSNKQRLGAMGEPIKLTIKGKPVFICCEGCQDKAEEDPDRTLAKLEELKGKKAGQK